MQRTCFSGCVVLNTCLANIVIVVVDMVAEETLVNEVASSALYRIELYGAKTYQANPSLSAFIKLDK